MILFRQVRNKTLNRDHERAVHYAEKLLDSFDDCQCLKKLKTRGLSGNMHRAASSKWSNEVASEIHCILDDSKNDYGFWRTRLPLPVKVKRSCDPI